MNDSCYPRADSLSSRLPKLNRNTPPPSLRVAFQWGLACVVGRLHGLSIRFVRLFCWGASYRGASRSHTHTCGGTRPSSDGKRGKNTPFLPCAPSTSLHRLGRELTTIADRAAPPPRARGKKKTSLRTPPPPLPVTSPEGRLRALSPFSNGPPCVERCPLRVSAFVNQPAADPTEALLPTRSCLEFSLCVRVSLLPLEKCDSLPSLPNSFSATTPAPSPAPPEFGPDDAAAVPPGQSSRLGRSTRHPILRGPKLPDSGFGQGRNRPTRRGAKTRLQFTVLCLLRAFWTGAPQPHV